MGNTVNIKLGSSLDYESTTSYDLEIIIEDLQGLSSKKKIVVKVVDVNDNIPRFLGGNNGTFVENDFERSGRVTIHADDADGTFPNNKVLTLKSILRALNAFKGFNRHSS